MNRADDPLPETGQRRLCRAVCPVRQFVLLSLLVLGGLMLGRALRAAEPPQSAATAEAEPAFGPGTASLEKAIDYFRHRVEQRPRDYISRGMLGRLYYRSARENQNGAHYDRAEDVLREALAINPDDPEARTALATVLMAHHQFAAALELLRAVCEQHPHDTEALAAMGDAQLELGQYENAAAAYQRLAERRDGAAVLARLARLDELSGRVDQAAERLAAAHETARRAGATSRQLAWYENRLAALDWSRGRLSAAAARLETIRRTVPDDVDALVGLARIRAAQGAYDGADELYQAALELSSDPTIFVALGDLYVAGDRLQDSRRMYRTAEAIWQHVQGDDAQRTASSKKSSLVPRVHGRHAHSHRYPEAGYRERSLYYSDHDLRPKRALELAQADLKARPDVYAYDTLAWALFRNHRWDEARDASDQALRLGTQDAKLYFHAGLIAFRRGDHAQAVTHLSHALDLNPDFSLLHRDLARRTLAEARRTVAAPRSGLER